MRNQHNDAYLHYYNKDLKYVDGEYQIQQEYSLFVFRGSVQLSDEESKKFQSGSMDEPTFMTPRDITLVSQTSVERFFFISSLLQRWKGSRFCYCFITSPISITIFVHKDALDNLIKQILQAHFPFRLLITLYIPLHPDKDCIQYPARNSSLHCRSQSFFPLNRLRNIALRRVATTHFLLVDMDSWPSEGTYDALQSLPRDYMDSSKFATIVPLFTFHPSYFSKERFAFREGILKAKELLPKTKEELIREIKENHFVRCGEVAQNHQYLPPEWYNLKNQTKVLYLPCFHSLWLEPYIMLRSSSSLQLFDETFVNYGFNKVQWIETLRYSGYEFYVLNDGFLMDMPHKSYG
ncbi:hypothetical protein JH06_3462 [Blastocystis sp. subtype 4]|uniref:hypothetical protein n=1 Tax=Blastocystis sp. subtype 4 TaxID=944170 RepID=UPI0007116DBF|nr:hypothetical protein JH06_3462 [Blastocystis sp. subtype 4]KNB44283.1 hypothetical protein JH06_3462 [Blastocystis sp. subtype 4]|eukprot:XP_014527726.1 hypothetical protein JH06_3462 [Blastocystis sp. subtype 4]